MNECLFCKIANKEMSSEVIYEDADSIAILDIKPLSLGHTMILPKKHAANIIELLPELIGPVFLAVRKVTELLARTLSPEGFTIGINQGRASIQTVDHLHIHIIPRWLNDGGGSIHSVVKNPPKESLEDIKNKILHG